MNDIAMSLSNSIPKNGKLIVHKDKFNDMFKKVANSRNTDVKIVESGKENKKSSRKILTSTILELH